MMPTRFKLILLVLFTFIFAQCVSKKKYDNLLAEKVKLEADKQLVEEQLVHAQNEITTLTEQTNKLNQQLRALQNDTLLLRTDNERLRVAYEELNESYERLLANYNRLLANSAAETGTLSKQLADKELQLSDLERGLNEMRQKLFAREKEVMQLSVAVEQREKKLQELESKLAEQEKAVQQLRHAVSDALLGFKEKDLSVQIKNGKVYVSLSDQLLFKSGKYNLESNQGIEVLKKLAQVLQNNPEINVMVEGHTDDVPVASGTAGLRDNWDLSVLRATSVANQLIAEGVGGQRIVASGRSKYVPLENAKTPEARQKNRRTEIILTPKLDELFQIIQHN
jgi:chemotaxis protein MotB